MYRPDWLTDTGIDDATIDQRVAAIVGAARRSHRLEDVLSAIQFLDLTSLADSDTASTVRELCRLAREPIPPEHPSHDADLRLAAVFSEASIERRRRGDQL